MGLNIKKPIAMMGERPPRCFLGCCNVRTWTITVSIINIVFLSLGIIICLTFFGASREKLLVEFMYGVVILINIRLRRAVYKRVLAPIRLWLAVYSVVFVITTIQLIDVIIAVVNLRAIEHNSNALNSQVIGKAGMALWLCGSCYPVYRYYSFEKTCSKRNDMLERQTV